MNRNLLGLPERSGYPSNSNIISYLPTQQFDVILFRDSIYYVPRAKIEGMLNRYSRYLKEDGVFIVRMWSASKYNAIMEIIENNFDVMEKHLFEQPEAVVIVFR